MQEAEVMQVMQNKVKNQLRGSGEGEEGGGGGHCDPYAGRGGGRLTSSADSHSFPIPYLTYPAATALSTTFLQIHLKHLLMYYSFHHCRTFLSSISIHSPRWKHYFMSIEDSNIARILQ